MCICVFCYLNYTTFSDEQEIENVYFSNKANWSLDSISKYRSVINSIKVTDWYNRFVLSLQRTHSQRRQSLDAYLRLYLQLWGES